MNSLYFYELPIGQLFTRNGNDYRKKSSRTACLLCSGRVFYFALKEVIHPIVN